MKNIEKLISISGQPLLESPSFSSELFDLVGDSVGAELYSLLREKNGFYAFESALHVFPSAFVEHPLIVTLEHWNKSDLWKDCYEKELGEYLFFAEDIFGSQFCLKENSVFEFDPETGDLEKICQSLDDWADKILQNYPVMTGYPIAHEWQKINGELPAKERLLPKIPFVGGGEFAVQNMYNMDAVKGMRLRAEIANQIRNLPDGATIKIVAE